MYADVIVDITASEVDRIFEYKVNSDDVAIGSRVVVPFGVKKLCGIVVGIKDKSVYSPERIKPISSVIENPPAVTEEMIKLMRFIEDKYFVTAASALRLFLPSEMRLGKVRELTANFVKIKDGIDKEKELANIKTSAKQQRAVLEKVLDGNSYKLSELSNEFARSAINALVKKGVLEVFTEKVNRNPYQNLNFKDKSVVLTERQENAVKSIIETDKQITLIHGVTGSGKTEVYLHLISKTILEGKTAIMLVPEIALTPQMLRQLRARFGDTAAILHSGLSNGERFDEWWRIRNGEAKIVIGARSAIFAPVSNLGLIIIDEEHDSSYVSEQSPRYKTLDIASFRAKENGAKIVLGSATPDVETYLKATKGIYNLVKLPERINKRPLPEVIIADMKREVRRGNNTMFSSFLRDELDECLKNGNQAILFLNQRGYSKSVICTECGHVHKCADCDVSLTYHAEDDSLLCHYCGAKYKMLTACTECGSKFLKHSGTGTEKIVYELQKMYPNARILRMDRDTTAKKQGHFKILNEFSEKKADILVGTQMIAKGHDFPSVTLVGILDADMSLHFSDFRSGERTFQLITQVAGRSGRAEEKGKVVLQTYTPENFILRQAVKYDYEKMFEHEISVRKATGFPPFSDIIRIMVVAENEEHAVTVTKALFNDVSALRDRFPTVFKFLACMKSPVKRIQNKFRYQIITRFSPDMDELVRRLYELTQKYTDKTVNCYVEINPNNLS